jgi:predicted metal-dependent hydrolase
MTSPDADEDTKSQVRELYERWLRRIAYPVLKTKTEIYARKLGVNVQKISIKSRWASLTKRARLISICISSKLHRML